MTTESDRFPAPAPIPNLPATPHRVARPDQTVLRLAGEDRVTFLQGLISNDVLAVTPENAVWAAFLTPQGKYLHDFIVTASGDALWLIVATARAEELLRRLRPYRLRSKVELSLVGDNIRIFNVFGDGAASLLELADRPGAARALPGGITFMDPRLIDLGAWVVVETGTDTPAADLPELPLAAWDYHRVARGVPDALADLIQEKSLLLESGFDELNGVSWSKGCYIGQELTARTKYRGLVKKRLMPVRINGPVPASGTILMLDGQEAGEMRSHADGLDGTIGMALIRLEAAATGHPLKTDAAEITPYRPFWAKF